MFLITGTTTVDLFISGFERLPRTEGDEFTVDSLAFCREPLRPALGGNGAISAYALGRLGAPVRFAGAIGEDWLGCEVTQWLAGAGVDMSYVGRRASAATATTVVVTDNLQNRLSFHHAGANETLAEADIPLALFDQADVWLLTSYSLLVGLRSSAIGDHLAAARRAGVVTALDIGPAAGEPVYLPEIAGLLGHVDYFLCNEHELAVCTGTDDLAAGMEKILALGTGCVVIKCGAEGATIWERNATPVKVAAFPVTARSTVGAGDSFNAGFLYAIHQGQNPAAAARFANAVAALLVSAEKGALGAPQLSMVEELLTFGVSGTDEAHIAP
jgi:sugar/nucleoside kinase (ribokinase family)